MAIVQHEVILAPDGESYQSSYSPYGDKIVYVSRNRIGHQQAQIYERDLSSGRERRLTFQNGNLSSPRYAPNEKSILYSSPTDELKENPPLLQAPKAESKLPLQYREPNEVYLHNLDSLEMTRLTKRPGFDGEARFSPDGREIFWTRNRNDRTEIVFQNVGGYGIPHMVFRLGTNPTQYAMSSDGKTAAWIEWDENYTISHLKIRKGKDVIEVNPAQTVVKTDIEFSRDGRWLVWAQADRDKSHFELWSYDVENLCARKLQVPDGSERRYPSLSPDLQWLTYTVIRDKKPQVARTTFVQPSGPCRPSN